MANYKFYAIRNGRKAGVVSSWRECESRTKGYSGAQFKGFNDRERAQSWINGGGCPTKQEQENGSKTTDPRPPAEGMAEVHIRYGEDETAWFAVCGDEIVASDVEDGPQAAMKQFILKVAVRCHGYRGNVVREEHGEITDEVREQV